MRTTSLFAAAAAALLVACGGGGGGGGGLPSNPDAGGPGTNPDANTSKPQPPSPINAHYKLLTFSQERDVDNDPPEKRYDDYVALLNREGAGGYRYLEGSPGGNIVSLHDTFLMVKDAETTYSYEYKTLEVDIMQPDALQRLLQQMKDQGAQGKVFVQIIGHMSISPDTNPVFGVLYRKDEGSSATYDFDAIAYPEAVADLVSAANTLGANGFRPWAVPTLITQGHAHFFVKDLSSAARYDVKAVISPLSVVGGEVKDVKAQIVEQGGQGYRLLKSRFLKGSDGQSNEYYFYVKDTTQSSSFEYEFLDNPDAVFGLQEANATQANAQTANGLRYFGAPDSPIFFRSLSCTGPLCVSPAKTEREEGSN